MRLMSSDVSNTSFANILSFPLCNNQNLFVMYIRWMEPVLKIKTFRWKCNCNYDNIIIFRSRCWHLNWPHFHCSFKIIFIEFQGSTKNYLVNWWKQLICLLSHKERPLCRLLIKNFIALFTFCKGCPSDCQTIFFYFWENY